MVIRLGAATALGLGLWAFNFYGVLSWLQPMIVRDRYILEFIPWWVGAATHLVFAWTILLTQPLGRHLPHRPAILARR
jgi:hypothetical protein